MKYIVFIICIATSISIGIWIGQGGLKSHTTDIISEQQPLTAPYSTVKNNTTTKDVVVTTPSITTTPVQPVTRSQANIVSPSYTQKNTPVEPPTEKVCLDYFLETMLTVFVVDEYGKDISTAVIDGTITMGPDKQYPASLSWSEWSGGSGYVGIRESFAPGTFNMSVRADGYVTQTREVKLTRDECHGIPQKITITLVR